MWFWWFMFISNLLVPVIMMVAGRMMWKNSPGKINSVYGYRTKQSMKNADTWKFAHEYCGRLWWKLGVILLIFSIAVQIPFFKGNEDTVGTVGGILMTIQMIVLIVSLFPTEAALKRTFSDNGTRK